MTQYLPGSADVMSDVFAALIAQGLIALVVYFAARLASAAGKFSLRTRITAATVIMLFVSLTIIRMGANAFATLVIMAVTIIAVTQYVLKDLSHVGIMNSFRSTEDGIKPDKSLALVNNNLDFLGIGADKLSKSDQFTKALERCQKAGGKMRFLLSTPKNSALSDLAQRNSKESQAYSGRVRESIREILHQGSRMRHGTVEVRLYELSSAFALPHFRLMFIDGRFCIFSHLVWNDREGMDNPQLVIRNKRLGRESESLYSAYHKYFEDLWNSPETSEISSLDDPRLAI